MHLVVCTQRPDADTVTPQLRAQLPATLALRCVTDTNSRVLLDSSAAADLAPRPGRAIWQWDREVEVQLPKLEKAEARALLAARYSSVQGDVSASRSEPARGCDHVRSLVWRVRPMPRDGYHPGTPSAPTEGGQGRGAPNGSLQSGPGYSTRSLIAAVVGPDGPDDPQVNLGKEVGHGPRNTAPSNTRGVTDVGEAGGGGTGRRTLLAGDLSEAFEALIALSDARWDLCAMRQEEPGREECWSVMVIESGRLLQAAGWIAGGLLGEDRSRVTARRLRGGSGR